jgi:hypothetical protein
MALFTDGAATNTEDLRSHDTQVLSVANVENIDITRKLQVAQEELSVELAEMLARLTTLGSYVTSPALGQVVATPALRLWHIYRTLEMIYADAFNSQLNDRYAGKRDEYHEMARWAREEVIRMGLGLAGNPVAQAGIPVVTAAAGGLPDGTYYVSVAWTNTAGEEGASSVQAVIATSSSSFTVRTTAPSTVAGYNVYCGTGAGSMTRQNQSVLPPGLSWTQPDTLSTSGAPAGNGQAPTYWMPVPRFIQRG